MHRINLERLIETFAAELIEQVEEDPDNFDNPERIWGSCEHVLLQNRDLWDQILAAVREKLRLSPLPIVDDYVKPWRVTE